MHSRDGLSLNLKLITRKGPRSIEHQSHKEVVPARQDEHESLETLFKNGDLTFRENAAIPYPANDSKGVLGLLKG